MSALVTFLAVAGIVTTAWAIPPHWLGLSHTAPHGSPATLWQTIPAPSIPASTSWTGYELQPHPRPGMRQVPQKTQKILPPQRNQMSTPSSEAIAAALNAYKAHLNSGSVAATLDSAIEAAMTAAAPFIAAQAQAEALKDMERVLFHIESQHHIHGVECLCGFKSHRSRSRTEHITGLVRAATIEGKDS